MNSLKTRITNLTTITHVLLTLVAFGAFRATNIVLDQMYARSQFPVPYQEGQTEFSGELIKSYYQVMIDAGTLNIYWQTQLFDYLFMAAMFLWGITMPLLVRRLYTKGSWPYRLASFAALSIPFGAAMDAVENLISFVMLAQPLTFPDWLAPIYSSFAAAKFAGIGSGYIAVFVSLILFAIGFLWSKVKRAGGSTALVA